MPAGVVEHQQKRGPTLYKSVHVPTRNFTAPASRVSALPASMREAFLAYVEEAAQRRRGTSLYARAHCPGAVAFLNELLDRALPGPEGAPPLPETEPEDISSESDFREGRRRTFVLDRHERNRGAREACIKAHGATCCVCGLSFADLYGELGDGFIEVHHLEPLANTKAERHVDPVLDLVPVCPNCHRMLHRRAPPLTPAELAALIRRDA